MEDTEATARWVHPPLCRATKFQALHRRGRRRHQPALTARSPLSPTSPTNRPSFKGCRSPPRASYGKWPGRAAAKRRRGAPRPRTRRASPASVVRFWGENPTPLNYAGFRVQLTGIARMILIRATVLVFSPNIWDSSFTPFESSAMHRRGAFTLASRY